MIPRVFWSKQVHVDNLPPEGPPFSVNLFII